MSEANKTVVLGMYEALNAHNLAAMAELVDDSFVEHEDNGTPPTKAGVVAFFETVLAAFPDFQMVPQQVIAEGDLVSVLVTATGTQRGEFMGIPAGNKTASVSVADFMKVKNGKVTEHWGVTDMLSMMQQLGVAPA
jgi:steroid delta-isomerase-like uncharacterized protein